jgi:site-specific DNA recombinase
MDQSETPRRNSRYRTRRSATFGVGPVHKILTNACYATGQWPYGVRSSRDGRPHDPSSVVYIAVPILIEKNDFERVQAKLTQNNPKTTPPRVVNGPSLLTGTAVCASCGAGMTRTGTTNRQGRSYSYYSCAGCAQKGKTVCKGRHIPAATLDDIVLTNLKTRVLAPDRLAELLKSLIERQAVKTESADHRLIALQKELTDADERLRRLYRSIEDGIVELDEILRERTAALKSQRERAKAALDHARAQCGTAAAIDAHKIDAFARLMNDKLGAADTNTRKAYIRSIIDAVEVDDRAIRIVGSKDILQAAIAGKQTENGNVRGFVRKWRAIQNKTANSSVILGIRRHPCQFPAVERCPSRDSATLTARSPKRLSRPSSDPMMEGPWCRFRRETRARERH